jgi:(E)-4-hydroxy-3-methylbut-2-enyl-diphosphate synthase
MNALEELTEDIIEPMSVSVIGCVVNGPGEALVSDLGLAGANRKSGFYINGQRQKLRIDNSNVAVELEQQIRRYLKNKAENPTIAIKQID